MSRLTEERVAAMTDEDKTAAAKEIVANMVLRGKAEFAVQISEKIEAGATIEDIKDFCGTFIVKTIIEMLGKL